MSQSLPQTLLFDLDDTILRAYGQPEAAWLVVAGEFAAELDGLTPAELAENATAFARTFWADPDRHRTWRLKLLDARREIVAGTLATLARAGRPTPAAELGRRIADRFTAYRDEQMGLFPGAIEVLDALRTSGVRLGLVTNGAGEAQRAKLSRFDLSRRFDHIQIEGEAGFGKPDERAYLHALQALDSRPHETWIVGDHLEWEVRAPQRLGIHAIWFDPDARGLPGDSPARPDRTIRLLSELLPDAASPFVTGG